MRIAADTSVLAYAEGVNDVLRQETAVRVLSSLAHHELVLQVQVMAELFRVLVRKRRVAAIEARRMVDEWRARFEHHPETTGRVLGAAMDLATHHQFQIFDAVILAASAEARCEMLLAEDMQDGFVWRGVTVINPFAPIPHPLLTHALTA